MALLTDIEQVKVDPDQSAKVVIDENSGVIVMGSMCASPPSPSPRAT